MMFHYEQPLPSVPSSHYLAFMVINNILIVYFPIHSDHLNDGDVQRFAV